MFLDLDRLSWRLERWKGDRIIRDVHARWDTMDADWDHRIFFERSMPTGRPFEATGTWDFPIIVLETPKGIKEVTGMMPEIRYLLIEGHLRRRCLNAVMSKGEAAPEHELFVMSLIKPAGQTLD